GRARGGAPARREHAGEVRLQREPVELVERHPLPATIGEPPGGEGDPRREALGRVDREPAVLAQPRRVRAVVQRDERLANPAVATPKRNPSGTTMGPDPSERAGNPTRVVGNWRGRPAMAKYLVVETRDPFDSNDVDDIYELATGLADDDSNDVTVFLVQNG